MKVMRRLFRFFVFISLLFLISYFLFPISVFASSEFETSYVVRYQAKADGTADVSQNITLTNIFSNLYATQYSLFFQSGQIENLQARDELGPLGIEIQKSGDSTQVILKFNQEVVGKDKTLNFSLSYNALDLVTKTGQIWEITVPKLSNSSEINEYQLQLLVPTSFGTAAYISPQPISSTQEENNYVYHFSKNQIAHAGVNAAFGQFQVFDFILNYHLDNPKISSVHTEIALPPDTAYQKVYYQSIEPKPSDIRVDKDGNWLAAYSLSHNQKLDIEAIGKVKIFSQPQKNFPQPDRTALETNLQEQKYWSVNHPSIQEKARELKSVKEIYGYVVNHLNYDLSRVEKGIERRGALAALGDPNSAICMEFTDLFIALARANGIPAREINGYAYTTNPRLRPLSLAADILHSWPEYWDDEKKVWVPVDPTWEKTTGGEDFFSKTDLNHFVFAIHGLDSQYPAPAGSYRAEGDDQKKVQVSFGRFENLRESEIKAEYSLSKTLIAGFKTKGSVKIQNFGPSAVYYLPIHITGENLDVSSQMEEEILVIPPFGQQTVPFEVKIENWLKLGQGKISLSLNGQVFSQTIKIRSIIWQGILPILGLFLILIAINFFFQRLTLQKGSVKKETGRF